MAAPFITNYVNLFEFFNNYVFGSIMLTIMGFALLLFILGIIFRMGMFLNFYICAVFLFAMTMIMGGLLFGVIMFAVAFIWLMIELFT